MGVHGHLRAPSVIRLILKICKSMARGNLIQGQGAGKIGDVVLMVRNGQQVSRVYTTSGSRSGKEASESSRIQRVKFGGASNQWGLYRYVCTRMYRKGRSSKQSDYNYFVKRNSTLLPYLSKDENKAGVHVLQPGIFSEGTLGRIELVQHYTPVYEEGTYTFIVYDSGANFTSHIQWGAPLSSFKSALREVYPFARKITYLLSFSTEINLEEGSTTYVSQNVNHFPVIIDLLEETQSGEDTSTIAQFFTSQISDPSLKALISAQNGAITAGPAIFYLSPSTAVENNLLGRLSLLVFATDDTASDCYTTSLREDGVNPTAGAYADWASYRTSNALRTAADSYGYQSGVMRDEIASAGNEISLQVQAHAARLASLDEVTSTAFLKSVGDVSQVKAKTVRKSSDEK